jgi:hypothetical protein
LRQTSEQLKQQDERGEFSEYFERAADQVDRLTNYLKSHDVREMVDRLERLARKQPGLFVGGAFVTGLLLARFLKSSPAQNRAYTTGPRTNF